MLVHFMAIPTCDVNILTWLLWLRTPINGNATIQGLSTAPSAYVNVTCFLFRKAIANIKILIYNDVNGVVNSDVAANLK